MDVKKPQLPNKLFFSVVEQRLLHLSSVVGKLDWITFPGESENEACDCFALSREYMQFLLGRLSSIGWAIYLTKDFSLTMNMMETKCVKGSLWVRM